MLRIFNLLKSLIEGFAGIIFTVLLVFLPVAAVMGIIFSILWVVRYAVTEIDCTFSQCVTVDGRKINSEDIFLISKACEEFLADDIGKVALRMSESAWIDRYEKFGLNDPLFRAYNSLQTLRSSRLKFEREWDKTDYQEIKSACTKLTKAAFS